MKNIKIGAKLIGGFIVVSILVLIVGFFGWNGSVQLQNHVHDIGNVKLPSIESLLGIKAEFSAIRIALRTMLNPRLTREDKARQFTNIEKARADYGRALEVYESLPHGTEEARVWRDFLTAWNALVEVNNQVLRMSQEIDRTDILNPDELQGRILGFIGDHHKLMSDVQTAIMRNRQVDYGADSTLCNFGRWTAAFSTTNEKLNSQLREISSYHNAFHDSVERINALIAAGNSAGAAQVFLNTMQPNAERTFQIFDQILAEANRIVDLYNQMNLLAFGEAVVRQNAALDLLDRLVELNDEMAEKAVHVAEADGRRVQGIALIGMFAGVALALVLGIVLTLGITRPLAKGVVFAKEIAAGDLDVTLDINQKDEVGQLADSLRFMLEALRYKGQLIERIADGDLTVEVQAASEKDSLGHSLIVMVQSLHDLLSQVNTSVDQVSAGADQVSQASQNLSQGATEQASSLEEISSSTNEINGQSRQNADNATEANALAKKANEDAQHGNRQMAELVTAMSKINASSDEIKKVVKVIDDIAFQINLLALNANVEAARAGKYGKGFAVVAEEVRNLAVRAASAVKETTNMVEDSISNIKKGNDIVAVTAKQLEDIVQGATKVANFLEEIATASKEQALAIEQITGGLDQIDQVTQSNTASAEESASASEELASQAQQLKAMISRFKLRRLEGPRPLLSDARMPGRQSHPTVARGGSKPQDPKNKVRDSAPPKKKDPAKGPTGITTLDPAEVIKLDDDDFDRF